MAEEAWRATLWAADRLAANAGDAAHQAIADPTAPAAVRCAALRFIARHGSQADATAALPGLSDPDPSVRVAAAATIASLAPERSNEVLADTAVADAAAMGPMVEAALQAGPDAAVKLFADDAGRQLVLPVVLGKKRADELIAVAGQPGADRNRLVAISSLGRIGGDQARQALQQILDDKSESDPARAAAFKALKRLLRRAEKQARYEEVSAR